MRRTLWSHAAVLAAFAAGCSPAPEDPAPSATYRLCSDDTAPGGVIAAADRLIKDGKTTAAAELYRARLSESAGDECAARGLAYIAALPEPETATSDWDAFFEDRVRPAYRLGLPFLAVLAVLALIARALTSTLVAPSKQACDKMRETGLTRRRIAYAGGLFLLAAAAAWATIVSPGLPAMGVVARASSWALAGLVAGAGIWLVSTTRGLTLRVRIEGRGSADDVTAGHLLARLQQLGSDRPSGAAMAVNTDVSALPDDALSALPHGDVAKAIVRMLQSLLSAIPWHVKITVVDERSLAIEISRNGRLVDAAVVGAPTSADDPAVRDAMRALGGAAFVLVTLANRHPALRAGLNGATRWRSVALQVMASHPGATPALQRSLLARAVELDPKNLGARVALLHLDGRRPADAVAAETYARGLEAVLGLDDAKPDRGDTALYMRAYFNAAASWLICYSYEASEKSLDCARRRAEQAGKFVTESRKKYPEVADLAEDIDPATTYLGLAAGIDRLQEPEPGRRLSMTALYTRACLRAVQAAHHLEEAERRRHVGGTADALTAVEHAETSFETQEFRRHLEEALDDLAGAVGMPGFAEWAGEDPSFAIFRVGGAPVDLRKRYLKIVNVKIASKFLELPPLREHAAVLLRLGIVEPDSLLQENPGELARAAKVTTGHVRRWRALAELATVTRSPSAERLPMSTVALLLAVGVGSLGDLRAALRPARRREFLNRVADEAAEHAVDFPSNALDGLDLAGRGRFFRIVDIVVRG